MPAKRRRGQLQNNKDGLKRGGPVGSGIGACSTCGSGGGRTNGNNGAAADRRTDGQQGSLSSAEHTSCRGTHLARRCAIL